MLAGRLVRAARDVLNEYKSFEILRHLNEAANLSATRGQQNPAQYADRAHNLRAWATKVINDSIIEKYPTDLFEFLKNSQYNSALPSKVAMVILYGFPNDSNVAISSAEVNVYIGLANVLISELSALDIAASKFYIDEISIPDSELSLDVILPRAIFDNQADQYLVILEKYIITLSYLTELSTGKAGVPSLTYTSTSDPVTGLAVYFSVGWAFLRLYKLALEVAEKQISLFKTVKEFRSSSLKTSDDLEEQIKDLINESLKKLVDTTVNSIPPKVPQERLNEIKVALNKDAKIIVNSIARA